MAYPLPHSLPLVPQELLRVPERVSLQRDVLLWEWGTARWVTCDDDVLGAFTILAGGELGQPSHRAVLKVAKRYGPLYARVQPFESGNAEAWREPLEDWRNWAGRVQAAAELAGRLGKGEEVSRAELDSLPDPGWFELGLSAVMTRTDLRQVLELGEGGNVSRAAFEQWWKRQVTWWGDEATPASPSSRRQAKTYVEGCVDHLLNLSKARLRLVWNEGEGPRITLFGLGFLAVVAGQLIGAAHGGKIAVCHACGAVITSGRRRPAGQRAFCDKECRAAFNKLYKRKERARRRTTDARASQ